MTNLNMNASVVLYLGSTWQSAHEQGPRSFPTAANAIRFAMEEAAPVSLKGALLVVEGRSLSGAEIAAVYRSKGYPYRRKLLRSLLTSESIRMAN